MRFLKTLSINRRAIYDDRLAVETDNAIVMRTTNNLLMPSGGISDRPLSPVVGMIRYNTDNDEVEIYQGTGGAATWRSLRFKESKEITQQFLGFGDEVEDTFGPLDPQPPASSLVENGGTWTGANIIVVVGGVYQIWDNNYLIKDGGYLNTLKGVSTYNPALYYIQFTSSVPGLDTRVYALHGFDQ